MTLYGNNPINFQAVSNVTLTPGKNDPELGSRVTVGNKDYLYVYNAGNSIIDKGMACVVSGLSGYSVTVSSTIRADIGIGVCANKSLATAAYGWVVTRGYVNIEMSGTSGTVAAGGLIELVADGLFGPSSNATGANGPVYGKAMAAIVSSASGLAYINMF